MMTSLSYAKRRGELEVYFDRTAAAAWARLTSDAPVSGVRATVRAGRDATRATLLSYLPQDLTGRRILDAGCGTGAFAFEAAKRGAEVVAIDLAGTLVGLAQTRVPADLGTGSVSFMTGDMLSPDLGDFDHVVAMDSIIHYEGADMTRVLDGWAARTRHSVLFTVAPQTPLLMVVFAIGKMFPRKDRSPAIVPIRDTDLWARLSRAPLWAKFGKGRTHRVSTGFYKSQIMELVRR
jgi:magnesium-protoporphyrin O-methyltransferase